jgi:hypothetical protein
VANTLSSAGREGFLTGAISWTADTIKVIATKAPYAFSAAHDRIDDVLVGGRVQISPALANKTAVAGVADADDVLFDNVILGQTITGLWIYKDSGVEATSILIGWMDTKGDGTPIALDTNGGDVVLNWNNGANRIFRL